MQKTSIIMAVFPNQFEYMKASIDSIRRFTTKESYELILVESGGCLETRSWLAEETEIRSLFFDEVISTSAALNEGIEISKYNSILIMHEDTLVTEGWLELLLDELYKNSNTGAVGPLTNFADDDQAHAVQFTSMEELLSFSKGLNEIKSVDERVTLSDFCLLFKRSVMGNTRIFDEELNGKISVIDFCLRIKEKGYRLALCRHVYVYHYGTNEISVDNNSEKNFKRKWDFNVKDIMMEYDVINSLVLPTKNAFKVLVVGFFKGGSATVFKLMKMYPNAEVAYYSLSQISNSLIHEKFDCIILSSGIYCEDTIALMKGILTDEGKLLVRLFNINYLGVVRQLLLGEGLDEGKRYWNLTEIAPIFEKAGFQELDFDYIFNDNLSGYDNSIIAGLGDLVEELPREFEVSSFLVSARIIPKHQLLHRLFDMLNQTYSDVVLDEILRFSTTQIISSIDNYEGVAIPLLNYLGIANFEREKLDDVLPYLARAHELENDNYLTIINLATVMHSVGNIEKALEWLERIRDKSKDVIKWIGVLEKDIYDKRIANTKVKFLLRRIENNVERETSSMELIDLLQQNGVSTNQIIKSVMVDIVDKTGTLNRVAINCFNSGLFENVIPLLEESYTVDPRNEDTLFNLAYILYKFELLMKPWIL